MLEFLKFLAFAAVAGFFVLQSITRKKGSRGNTEFGVSVPTAITGAASLVAVLIGLSSFGTLGAGERGVVTRFGAVTGRVLQPGLYGVIPVIESVHAMDVRIQKETQKASAASKDLQQVTTEVAVNFSLDPAKVDSVYTTLGDEYKSRIIDPAIQEAVKAVKALYNAEKLIADRHLVKEALTNALADRLAVNGILVEAVSITDFSFDPDFAAAIEAKVRATQEAMKAENDLKTAKFVADQRIAQARGEAEAIRIQVEAIRSQGGEGYVALKAIEKWNGSVPQWVTGGSGGQSPIPFIQLSPPVKGN